MAEKSRFTVAAVLEEAVAGTLESPTASTEYIPLQDGAYEMDPAFETLENAELRASIGRAKPILGLESPTASLSHYLKGSGTEGQRPAYAPLIKSAFGDEELNATEYSTDTGSTTSVIVVPTGDGANFLRGEGLLIKDSANVWSIRPIESVSGDNLTLAFNLDNAPAAGVDLGKAVKYTVADDGHPSLSLWYFQGNGGAIEAESGLLVSEMNLTAETGQPVQCDFSMEGNEYFFDPIEITSTTHSIDFVTDAGTHVATLATDIYKDPYEMAAEIESKMNGQLTGGEAVTVTYNSRGTDKGKFTIVATGTAVFSILWNNGVNVATSAGATLGFDAVNDTGALTYKSDVVQDWSSYQAPTYDPTDMLVAKNQEVFIGDADDNVCACVQSLTFNLTNTVEKVPCICEESGVLERVITKREISVDIVMLLERHEAENFHRFHTNDEVKFMYAFGTKTGNNWNPGESGCLYLPDATIQNFNVTDTDGLVTIELTLYAFVNEDGDPECYLNFL